ncbi:hypothetical protein LCGC14_2012160 [marine sediment metagenome]|uniref:Lipocalin-like domain-containing protein n=2 Tax=root TaxID=1 RepID=A0A831QM74_9FLAO|nr:hypothetical protein [Pricia antarctica]
MKKIFSLLAIIGIITVSNCTRIPENNNPVIGIWSDIAISSEDLSAKKETIRQEWIFNDAYLGRYHKKQNGSITFKTDFKWSFEDDIYTISYPGTDMPVEKVSMLKSEEATTLTDTEGNIIATRE